MKENLIVLCITLIILYFNAFKKFILRNKYKYWKVGDEIFLDKNYLEKNEGIVLPNIVSFKLVGWTSDYVVIEVNDKIKIIKMRYLINNKSAKRREYYIKCNEFMGFSPGFKKELVYIEKKIEVKNNILNNKSVESLTEIECQIYLKSAIEQEDYMLAEKIRKQMEKYR
jgi:hypothetical protein